MFVAKTIKHPIERKHKRLDVDGTAPPPRRYIEVPDKEEDVHPESDSSWCIDHGELLPEREQR